MAEERLVEIFGTYFVNCYWNNLHEVSLTQYGDGRYGSHRDAFRAAVQIFNTAFCDRRKSKRAYVDVMGNIRCFFEEYCGESRTYDQFIDYVAATLLPKERYDQLQSRQKHDIINEIMRKTLTAFSAFALEHDRVLLDPALRGDRVKRQKEMQRWRSHYIELLRGEVNTFCSLLLAKESSVDLGDPTASPTIPLEVCDRLKARIRDLLREKAQITEQYNRAVQYVLELKKIIATLESELAQARAAAAIPPTTLVADPQSEVSPAALVADPQPEVSPDAQPEVSPAGDPTDLLAEFGYEPLTPSEG